MLIPPEYAKHFNHATGMLEGYYQNHTIQMLLVSEINRTYLRKLLNRKIRDVNVIRKYNPRLNSSYVLKNFPIVEPAIYNAMSKKLNERWTPQNRNNLIELDRINNAVLTETIRNTLNNPQILNPAYNSIEPVSGKMDRGFGLTMGAFDGEYYRPEQVIENSYLNQSQPYWVPRKVEWHTNPEYVDYNTDGTEFNTHRVESFNNANQLDGFTKTSDNCGDYDRTSNTHWVGHKWKYHSRKRDPRAPKHVWNDGTEVPYWRKGVHTRPYSRTSEGYRRHGSDSDRNRNRNRGYDMSSLTGCPSRPKYPWDL